VGGDFYSYEAFGDGRVALAVGDVSGKGVSAALLMATSISLFNANMGRKAQPSMLLAQLDTDLVPYTKPRNQNCALCYIEFDGATMRIANAGGVPPYVRRSTGAVEWPEVWGFALGQGLGAEIGYQSMAVQVGLGDVVVLVSDGVVEAKNSDGAMFSFDRLERTIAQGPISSAQEMVDHVVDELTRFVGRTEPHDDVTIAALRICGSLPGNEYR
jgi:serine phosphatase RsbU (regulator of sigma subunit)